MAPEIRDWQQPSKQRCSNPGNPQGHLLTSGGNGQHAYSPVLTRAAARAATANMPHCLVMMVVHSRSLVHVRSCGVSHGTFGSIAQRALSTLTCSGAEVAGLDGASARDGALGAEVGESAVRPQLMVLQRIKAVRAAATLRARPRRSVPPAYGPSCVRARDMGRQATIRALGGDLGAYVAQWSCANAGTRRSAGRRGRSAASAPLAHQQHAAPHVDLWDVSRSRLALCPRSSRTSAP